MPLSKIWIHAEIGGDKPSSVTLEIATKARELADTVEAFYAGENAEAVAAELGRAQQVEVDLDRVHLLHAADVRVPELLVRVEERAGALDAGRRVDDLVAVHLAAPALDLVLGAQRQRRRGLGAGLRGVHERDCGERRPRAASGPGRQSFPVSRRTTFRTSIGVNAS